MESGSIIVKAEIKNNNKSTRNDNKRNHIHTLANAIHTFPMKFDVFSVCECSAAVSTKKTSVKEDVKDEEDVKTVCIGCKG